MSTGGIYTLLTNKGFQSKVLLANEELKARVIDIKVKNKQRAWKRARCKAQQNAIINGLDPNKVKVVVPQMAWDATLDQIERSHVLVVNASYKPFVTIGFEYSKVMSQGGVSLGGSFDFTIPQVGDFFSDMVLHLRLKNLTSVSALDKVRYVAYPGHKIIEKMEFSVNNNPLDEITRDNYTSYYQNNVLPHKRKAWDRNVGQEIPFEGHVTPDPQIDEFRLYQRVGTGPQTFKNSHPVLDLWIPVLMWFKDVKLAFPQLVVPYGQTRLQVTLAALTDLVSFADYGGGGKYTRPQIDRCDLYVNNIYLEPHMHDLFLSNFGFTLIRVHRQQIKHCTSSTKRIKLNNLKWPIECMYIGFRPQSNLAISQHWYKNQVLTPINIPVPVIVGTELRINNVVYYDEAPVIDFLKLDANGICLFKESPSQFFHSYLPSQYGQKVNASNDAGWHMMNFGFTPGEYQPRGYLNVSKAREFYLSYRAETTAGINALASGVDMIVLADCINFLYVKEATALLKFS